MTRAQDWAQDWAQKNSSVAAHCLRYAGSNVLCHAVTSGRISGWVIYNCVSGQEFLAALNPEQLDLIWPYIDSDRWSRCFAEYPADQALCSKMLKEAGW